MAPLISIKNLYFSYGEQLVLENINLEVNRGDFLAILGPNGSGKTTLIKLILGLLKPQKGEIRLFGQPSATFKERWRLGYVPQRAIARVDPVFPVSVAEVVSFGLLPKKPFPRFMKASDWEAVREALRQV